MAKIVACVEPQIPLCVLRAEIQVSACFTDCGETLREAELTRSLHIHSVDVETIMKIVGHSSVEMFLRYRAVDDEELDAAMQKLEARQAYAPTPIQHHGRGQAATSS